MRKITVTESQMGSIKRQRDEYRWHLEEVLEFKQNGKFKKESNRSLNEMSIEQIVLAWYSHVNVEPEKVDFFEAMKAVSLGKDVNYHYTVILFVGEVLEKTLKINLDTKPIYFNKDTEWKDLVNGKWSIED